jgi:hypothetical protein
MNATKINSVFLPEPLICNDMLEGVIYTYPMSHLAHGFTTTLRLLRGQIRRNSLNNINALSLAPIDNMLHIELRRKNA